VTFAEHAVEGFEVPWTSNPVERLMGEVSKRCKNQWMRWTAEGLEAIIQLRLVKYADPEYYQAFLDELLQRSTKTAINCDLSSIESTSGKVCRPLCNTTNNFDFESLERDGRWCFEAPSVASPSRERSSTPTPRAAVAFTEATIDRPGSSPSVSTLRRVTSATSSVSLPPSPPSALSRSIPTRATASPASSHETVPGNRFRTPRPLGSRHVAWRVETHGVGADRHRRRRGVGRNDSQNLPRSGLDGREFSVAVDNRSPEHRLVDAGDALVGRDQPVEPRQQLPRRRRQRTATAVGSATSALDQGADRLLERHHPLLEAG